MFSPNSFAPRMIRFLAHFSCSLSSTHSSFFAAYIALCTSSVALGWHWYSTSILFAGLYIRVLDEKVCHIVYCKVGSPFWFTMMLLFGQTSVWSILSSSNSNFYHQNSLAVFLCYRFCMPKKTVLHLFTTWFNFAIGNCGTLYTPRQWMHYIWRVNPRCPYRNRHIGTLVDLMMCSAVQRHSSPSPLFRCAVTFSSFSQKLKFLFFYESFSLQLRCAHILFSISQFQRDVLCWAALAYI